MLGTPSEPIIDIVEPDGTRHRAKFMIGGQQYAAGYDAANSEAKKELGLTEWKLETVGWTKPQPYEFGPYHLD